MVIRIFFFFFFTKHVQPSGRVHMEECSWSAKRSIRSATIRKSTLLGPDWDADLWRSRLLVGAHGVDVFKGQILPGGESGYHDREITPHQRSYRQTRGNPVVGSSMVVFTKQKKMLNVLLG